MSSNDELNIETEAAVEVLKWILQTFNDYYDEAEALNKIEHTDYTSGRAQAYFEMRDIIENRIDCFKKDE